MSVRAPGAGEDAAIGPLAEAAAWRVRLADAGMDSCEAFEAWLAVDAAHVEAWRRVDGPWALIGDHATAPELMALRRDALHRARLHGRRRWMGFSGLAGRAFAAAAVVAVLAAGIGAWAWNAQRPDVYLTALGERRVIPLEDGSRISLDSGSEVRVRYTADTRRLELRAGQARFDVAHDAQRPFSVRARDQLVVATGTAFNVDLLGGKVLVTLIEGQVEVLEGAARPLLARKPVPTDEPAPEPQRQVLRVGEQLVAEPRRVPTVSKVDISRTIAWEGGQLVFTDEPLAAVAERVGRYSGQPIRVDAAAGELRISGVFRAGDVETFVDTVTRYLPVAASVREDGGIVLHGKG